MTSWDLSPEEPGVLLAYAPCLGSIFVPHRKKVEGKHLHAFKLLLYLALQNPQGSLCSRGPSLQQHTSKTTTSGPSALRSLRLCIL